MHYDAFVRRALPEFDLNWRKYRRRQSRRGVHERMKELGLDEYKDYLKYLRSHPDEGEVLVERMRVTVTRFFRDRECWNALANIVLPELATDAQGGLRILSAGCAGGEEPYSLAMLWREHFEEEYPDQTPEILAVDTDETNLARARTGRYPPGSMKEMDERMRERWFRREGDVLNIDPAIRSMVHLERLDLMQGGPPGVFHLVLCRYLFFTYFTGNRLRRAAGTLHAALLPDGALMIGRRGSVTAELADLFEPFPQAGPCFFRKNPHAE